MSALSMVTEELHGRRRCERIGSADRWLKAAGVEVERIGLEAGTADALASDLRCLSARQRHATPFKRLKSHSSRFNAINAKN
jgi:hypothetical protein